MPDSKRYRENRDREILDSRLRYRNSRERVLETRKSYADKNKEKRYAKEKIRTEIEAGRMVRQPCSICGSEDAHGHHPDYSKPLEIVWLCRSHHREAHREMKIAALTHVHEEEKANE